MTGLAEPNLARRMGRKTPIPRTTTDRKAPPPTRSATAGGKQTHSPIRPGQGPVRGITLEDAIAAVQAARPTRTAEPVASASTGAVTSVFLPGAGTLIVLGTSADDSIVVSRDPAGKLLINDGTVSVLGGTATVANTSLVEIFGLDGNDTLSLNEVNGALPGALIFWGQWKRHPHRRLVRRSAIRPGGQRHPFRQGRQ